MTPGVEWPSPLLAFVYVPIETVSEANQRGWWKLKEKRRKAQIEAGFLHIVQHISPAMRKRILTVQLHRIGPRKLDKDNLAGALKYVQDGVASAIGIDDGNDDVYQWPTQETAPWLYGVRVRLTFDTLKLSTGQTLGTDPSEATSEASTALRSSAPDVTSDASRLVTSK